jgi:hypothetical protein
MLLWDEIQGEPSRASTQVPRRHWWRQFLRGIGDYCCSGRVRHERGQSSVPACRPLAETFASALRSLSGWAREAREVQRRTGRASDGRSSGKSPLSDDDQWPLCATTSRSPTAWRTGKIDRLLPFKIGQIDGREARESGLRRWRAFDLAFAASTGHPCAAEAKYPLILGQTQSRLVNFVLLELGEFQ